MAWNGLERNKLDYILTDLLPVELSGLFSFYKFYEYLSDKEQKEKLEAITADLAKTKAEGKKVMFKDKWASHPLKYKILKGCDGLREMSVIHPLAALNVFFFMELYQKNILYFFDEYHDFSIRYQRKNTELYYKAKKNKGKEYFHKQSLSAGKQGISQLGNYFKIAPHQSITSFMNSQEWRLCNLQFRYYAKMDYKSCFDSIYTHAFSWIVEGNVIDAKNNGNSNLFVTIDRLLQNINGRISNGILVGPEFSRMIAELLFQYVDNKVLLNLEKEGITHIEDYKIYRYVDDIFVFANKKQVLDKIQKQYRTIGEKYFLRLNELKMATGETPFSPKEWLEKTRCLADAISNLFFQGSKAEYEELEEDKKFLFKKNFVYVDRIKDEIVSLIKQYPKDKHTIVSFLLSAFLNNISKKNTGYRLFEKDKIGKVSLVLEIVLYLYAFYPSFEQTRKVLSIISYINTEFDFKNNTAYKDKLSKIINKYSFIIRDGNFYDICDWFPFMTEYGISIDKKSEDYIVRVVEKLDNPIIWANILIYSGYYQPFQKEIVANIEKIIEKKLDKIIPSEAVMQPEFWYVMIFYNCPYLSSVVISEIDSKINEIKTITGNSKEKDRPVMKTLAILCDFMSIKGNTRPKESFFNWKGVSDFANAITYRTYQRTIFKNYKSDKYGIEVSLG